MKLINKKNIISIYILNKINLLRGLVTNVL